MSETRAGFIALIGEPNAGKSTMLNALIGVKLSIVTHKVQTTRGRIRGVLNVEGDQLVFVDTPGLFAPKRRLDRAMVSAAWAGAGEADAVVLLIDAQKGVTDGVRRIVEQCRQQISPDIPIAVAVNKIDKVRHNALLILTDDIVKLHDFARVFYVSSTKKDGLDDMVGWLRDLMPAGPWLYPEDQVGDASLRTIAAEMTREKLMLRLHQELPYQLTVGTDTWEDRDDGSVRIEQTIYIAKEGHRPIVLGKGGQTLKAVGQESRRDLADMLGHPVHLFLHVQVDPRWLDDGDRYAEMGLELPKG